MRWANEHISKLFVLLLSKPQRHLDLAATYSSWTGFFNIFVSLDRKNSARILSLTRLDIQQKRILLVWHDVPRKCSVVEKRTKLFFSTNVTTFGYCNKTRQASETPTTSEPIQPIIQYAFSHVWSFIHHVSHLILVWF